MDNSRAELRKWEDNLNVGGLGVVTLGVWTSVKVVIEMFTELKEIITEIRQDFSGGDRMIGYAIMWGVIAGILLMVLLIMSFHVYIGTNAMKAARGQAYKKGYYKGAVIMLVLTALSLTSYYNMFNDLENIDTSIAALLVDITTIYCFALVIRSSGKVKHLEQNGFTREK